MTDARVPLPKELYNPVLAALKRLGGSGTNQEIHDAVVTSLGLSDEQVEAMHGSSNMTQLSYRLGWARTYLKRAGYLDNSARGVWALTALGQETKAVDQDKVYREVTQQVRQERESKANADAPEMDEATDDLPSEDLDGGAENWRNDLHATLLAMQPDAFERLCQRLLRESGFTQVDVTGRSGDGGIDGIGVMRIGGFLSFRVLFQCKRYKGSVGSSTVRDFRGAMSGRTDKGIIITTGTFTRDAQREARRDGAPEIDLVDGELLIDKLRQLELGVSVEKVERVTVDAGWFEGI